MQAGALVAGVVFALTSDKGKFYISAACGLAGVICTFLFIPDITGLDLREGDRRWLKSLEKGLRLAPCHPACLCSPAVSALQVVHCRSACCCSRGMSSLQLYNAALPAQEERVHSLQQPHMPSVSCTVWVLQQNDTSHCVKDQSNCTCA